MLNWRYVRYGACEFCRDPATPLRTPVLNPPYPSATPLLFCARCRTRFENAIHDGDWICVWVDDKRRR